MEITVNGARYEVDIRGSGPPLLLLHGFTGCAATWDAFVAKASDHFTTIAPDLLGHGRSEVVEDPSRYAMARWADDMLGILDHLGHERVAAMGYSMGGRLLVCTACAAPARFTQLVLEGATPGIASEDERAAQRATDDALANTIEEHGIAHFVALWEKKLASDRQPEEVKRVLHEQRMRSSVRGLANTLRGVGPGAQPPQHANLGRLRMPTLLVVGGEDHHFQPIARDLASAIADARLVTVPGAGHTVHLDAPEAFRRVVLEFLLAGG